MHGGFGYGLIALAVLITMISRIEARGLRDNRDLAAAIGLLIVFGVALWRYLVLL